MIEWVVFIASIFAMLGAGLRLQVVIREHAEEIETSSTKSLVWAGASSVRVLKVGSPRDLVDMKAGGAMLGLVGSLIVFALAIVAILR